MKVQKGSVVKAAAGRDDGGYFVVTGVQNGFCFIADGKSRRLDSPKRKNIKHLRFTNSMIDLNDITDKKLRTLLKEFSAAE
ncbi:MAG: KOW domain-containing RNA-binding protein [Ruminococcus sp.]|nr:KOW domain-containing RNA-binding protein [Ruminococcus sp.]MCD7811870.1 KOW domain-containing RNA-binding protein [Ruminococcus sp.]